MNIKDLIYKNSCKIVMRSLSEYPHSFEKIKLQTKSEEDYKTEIKYKKNSQESSFKKQVYFDISFEEIVNYEKVDLTTELDMKLMKYSGEINKKFDKNEIQDLDDLLLYIGIPYKPKFIKFYTYSDYKNQKYYLKNETVLKNFINPLLTVNYNFYFKNKKTKIFNNLVIYDFHDHYIRKGLPKLNNLNMNQNIPIKKNINVKFKFSDKDIILNENEYDYFSKYFDLFNFTINNTEGEKNINLKEFSSKIFEFLFDFKKIKYYINKTLFVIYDYKIEDKEDIYTIYNLKPVKIILLKIKQINYNLIKLEKFIDYFQYNQGDHKLNLLLEKINNLENKKFKYYFNIDNDDLNKKTNKLSFKNFVSINKKSNHLEDEVYIIKKEKYTDFERLHVNDFDFICKDIQNHMKKCFKNKIMIKNNYKKNKNIYSGFDDILILKK